MLLWTAADVVLLALALMTLGFLRLPAWTKADPVQWRTCERALEGDDLLLDHGGRVRLVGVDAPDMGRRRPDEAGSREARDFTARLAAGRRVRLVPAGRLPHDRLGRTLAYVYLEDGTFVNAELVRQGWSPAYGKYWHPQRRQFAALEREARLARRGLWAGPGR